MKNHPSQVTIGKTDSQGFTVLEIIVVLVLMAILMTVFIVRTAGINQMARDSERQDDVANIIRQLEDVYTTKKLGAPDYPDTVQITGNTVFAGTDPEILKAPNTTSSSIVVATNAVATTAGVTPIPTINQYVYQPLTSLGALCTSGLNCVKYNIYYRTEVDGTVWQKKSLHQQ